MEKRQVTQIKIYKLFLNDMRMNIPDLAVISYLEESIDKWLDLQKVESYTEEEEIESEDGTKQLIIWNKIFKKDSNMEWYNLEVPQNGMKYGVHTQWINEGDFELFMTEYPMIPII